jgi:hypothetical protein
MVLTSYAQFIEAFQTQFRHNWVMPKGIDALFAMEKKDSESLKEFHLKFKKTVSEIPRVADQLVIYAFKEAIANDASGFFKNLTLEVPRDKEELYKRVQNYIRAEDDEIGRAPKEGTKARAGWDRQTTRQPNGEPRPSRKFTKFKVPYDEIYKKIKKQEYSPSAKATL